MRWYIKRGIVVEGLRDCFQRYPVLFQTLLIREYEDVALWLIESKVIIQRDYEYLTQIRSPILEKRLLHGELYL